MMMGGWEGGEEWGGGGGVGVSYGPKRDSNRNLYFHGESGVLTASTHRCHE